MKRNHRLYTGGRVKQTCGSHSVFVGGHPSTPGTFPIYIDKEFLSDNITEGQHLVELIYEQLDDMDQYETGDFYPDGNNFLT